MHKYAILYKSNGGVTSTRFDAHYTHFNFNQTTMKNESTRILSYQTPGVNDSKVKSPQTLIQSNTSEKRIKKKEVNKEVLSSSAYPRESRGVAEIREKAKGSARPHDDLPRRE